LIPLCVAVTRSAQSEASTGPFKTKQTLCEIGSDNVNSDIVGIDLGTTNSLIGVMEAGFPILLADANGARLTPSVVYFPEEGEPLVGAAASRMRALQPQTTIYSAKRLIGLRGDDLPETPSDYRVVRRAGEPVRIAVRNRVYAPEEISALILGKLKRDAETALERPVTRAVITVPAYFNDAQRNATKAAGEAAGFTVERIINEPTAAALAYGLDRLKSKSKIAVYDLGGGTFDISILELNDGVFQVLATSGNTRLGGDDVDEAVIANCQLPIANWQKRELVIEARHRLSTETEVQLPVPFVEGKNLTYELTREELEKMARALSARPGRREDRGEGSRRGHSGWRNDAHAARQAIGRGDLRTRAQHFAESGRSSGARRDDSGWDSLRRGARRGAARRHPAVVRHRDLRWLDERHHSAQLDHSHQGGRDVHDRGQQSALDEDQGPARRAGAGGGQLGAGRV
jgi:actin-like ATPase involved in cell morphogenesis